MSRCLICYETLDTVGDYHASCSEQLFGSPHAPQLEYDLADMAVLAEKVVHTRVAMSGVQPKLSLTFPSPTVRDRLTIVGLWNGLYVLKPPSTMYPQLPENEAVTMQLAKHCGIPTAAHGLIRLRSGELAYIARRFDRILIDDGQRVQRLAQEDMCQLSGVLTEHKYRSSAERVAKVVYRYSSNKGFEVQQLFALLVFSFMTGNGDMHLKNYSLLTRSDGHVGLAPAYDLVATQLALPQDSEESALTIYGKKRKLSVHDFLAMAEQVNIPTSAAQHIITSLTASLEAMQAKVRQSFLSPAMQEQYCALLACRAERLQNR